MHDHNPQAGWFTDVNKNVSPLCRQRCSIFVSLRDVVWVFGKLNIHNIKHQSQPRKVVSTVLDCVYATRVDSVGAFYLSVTMLTSFFCSLFASPSPLQYEPVFDSGTSASYVYHMILHECQGSSPELEIMSRENGCPCYRADKSILTCNSIVAAWTRGSEVSGRNKQTNGMSQGAFHWVTHAVF